jgi:hypothetical protein
MSTKNYGPASSGYLDPTGRNWENPVFQAGKPVLDKELNLVEDLSSGFGQGALRRAMPSGWISDDFTASSDMAAAIFTLSGNSNELLTPNNLVAHVNGWLLNVAFTNSPPPPLGGWNSLNLPAAPLAAGTLRTDLVVLEVWRKLVSAPPSLDGKSPLNRIWLNGNVKIDPNPVFDAALNPSDADILDTAVGVETTKRVQIQYRLRVITGVDINAYPYGLNDPTVVANSVPPNAATPDGTPTSFQYANQSDSGDAGLWRAGDGIPLNALQTVDGYMYAIPFMAVVRRNQSPFDKDTNHNGGSGRPDGLTHDIFVARDIVDLRHGVSPVGWNYQEVLAKNFSYLLDNALRTEWTQTAIGGGYAGHTVFTADEIGQTDTPGANLIGAFDRVRRHFSDRETVETVTLAIDAPGGMWAAGATLTVAPNLLPIYPFGAPLNWSACNATGGIFLDLKNFRWIGEVAGKQTLDATPYIQTVLGLGTQVGVPLGPDTVTVNLAAAIPGTLTDERLFVDLVVSYPRGLGLVNTPTNTFSGSVSVNPPGLPAGTALVPPVFDFSHREVQLQVTEPSVTVTFEADSSAMSTSFTLPERASSVVGVLKNGGAIAGSFTLDPDGRLITFSIETFMPADQITVTYVPLRPLPEVGVEVTVYYETRAPMTGRPAIIGTTPLTVIPRYIDSSLYVLTAGSGSQDEAYPYPYAYTQLGGIFPTSVGTFAGDHELAAGAPIFTSDFNASTGFLKMPTYIGYTPNPQEVTFQRGVGNVDAEFRTFYPQVPAGVYDPNAYAQPLTDNKRHRNVLPMLAELTADCPLGFKGQLVMVLLIREAIFDKSNSVVFSPVATTNTTVASVFRLKGNPLNRRS